jgi:hypothetical protein
LESKRRHTPLKLCGAQSESQYAEWKYLSARQSLTSAIYFSALKSTVRRTKGGERDKMLKSKQDNYALERLKVEQVVVTERYCRDTAQWDKMRAFWHPRDEQTSLKITWFNGTIDGHIEGSKAMAQKSGLTGVKHTILPVDVTSKSTSITRLTSSSRRQSHV